MIYINEYNKIKLIKKDDFSILLSISYHAKYYTIDDIVIIYNFYYNIVIIYNFFFNLEMNYIFIFAI